eukprot:1723802-Pyramimonas_sp.AAC.1
MQNNAKQPDSKQCNIFGIEHGGPGRRRLSLPPCSIAWTGGNLKPKTECQTLNLNCMFWDPTSAT